MNQYLIAYGTPPSFMFLGVEFAFVRPSKGHNNNVVRTHILNADCKECNYEQKAVIETNRDKVNVCVKMSTSNITWNLVFVISICLRSKSTVVFPTNNQNLTTF